MVPQIHFPGPLHHTPEQEHDLQYGEVLDLSTPPCKITHQDSEATADDSMEMHQGSPTQMDTDQTPPKQEEAEALLMLERLSLDRAPVDDGSLIPSYFPSKLAEVARDTLVTAFDEEQFKEPLRHQLHGIFRYCAQHITNPEIREDLLSSIRNPGKCVICLGDHASGQRI